MNGRRIKSFSRSDRTRARLGGTGRAGVSSRSVPPAVNVVPPRVEVVIEVPRGSFLKRGGEGRLEFVSPLPCPFNYGAVPTLIGGDGDLLDAVVLGPRLDRGRRVSLPAYGAVGFTDHGIYDDKLICSPRPVSRRARRRVLAFFQVYALCKRLLPLPGAGPGATVCLGWSDAHQAISRARGAAAQGRGRRAGRSPSSRISNRLSKKDFTL